MMSPLHLAAALFVLGLPLLEIGVLIEVGRWLGLWATLGLLVLSCGPAHQVIRWIPPLDAAPAEISEGLELFGEALRTA